MGDIEGRRRWEATGRGNATVSGMQTLRTLYVGGGILLVALAVPMILRRVPPNHLYGFRVPSTTDDPALWYPVNRYSGWRLLVLGLVTIAAALSFARIPGISVDTYAWTCLAVGAGGMGVVLIQSFSYLRRLKSSRAGARVGSDPSKAGDKFTN
jgi:hypothetical protein